MMTNHADPHAGQHVRTGGAPLSRAKLAMVLVHGRGGSASDMLMLAEEFAQPDVAYLAPEAAGGSWWPQSFLAPLSANEPGLTSGLSAIGTIVRHLETEGISRERVVIAGFSQGACLALEFAAREGAIFAGVLGLSGGIVGTGDANGSSQDDLYGYGAKLFDYDGDLAGTPVFLGCHERDPHIPLKRVRESEVVFGNLGAKVTAQIFPGSGHGIVVDELRSVRALLSTHPSSVTSAEHIDAPAARA